MILDNENLLSNDQAVTVTAASEDVLDLGGANAGDMSPGEPLELFCQVSEEDFAGGTSIAVAVQCDDNAAFSSATTLFTTAAIATASLVQGYKFALGSLPEGCERYLRFNYTVVGTMTAGKLTGGIVPDIQSNT